MKLDDLAKHWLLGIKSYFWLEKFNSIDWFLYDRDLRYEKVNGKICMSNAWDNCFNQFIDKVISWLQQIMESWNLKKQSSRGFLRLATLLKKRLWQNCVPVNPFLYRTPLVAASQSWLVRNPEKRKWYLALQSSSRTKNFGRSKLVRFWSLNYTFDLAKQKTKNKNTTIIYFASIY